MFVCVCACACLFIYRYVHICTYLQVYMRAHRETYSPAGRQATDSQGQAPVDFIMLVKRFGGFIACMILSEEGPAQI